MSLTENSTEQSENDIMQQMSPKHQYAA